MSHYLAYKKSICGAFPLKIININGKPIDQPVRKLETIRLGGGEGGGVFEALGRASAASILLRVGTRASGCVECNGAGFSLKL